MEGAGGDLVLISEVTGVGGVADGDARRDRRVQLSRAPPPLLLRVPLEDPLPANTTPRPAVSSTTRQLPAAGRLGPRALGLKGQRSMRGVGRAGSGARHVQSGLEGVKCV
eukprot:2109175-Rhodomonas_salina.1